jgi:hypothetical protein
MPNWLTCSAAFFPCSGLAGGVYATRSNRDGNIKTEIVSARRVEQLGMRVHSTDDCGYMSFIHFVGYINADNGFMLTYKFDIHILNQQFQVSSENKNSFMFYA